ncbi:MAG: phosphotransferase family protein [Roseobacter sp.]
MHQFEKPALETYLARHVEGFTTLDAMDKFDDGQSNPTYLLKSGESTFVLRAKPTGNLLKSAHAVDREYRVMKALATTQVPVPKTYHLSPDASPLGAQFMVMEWVDGRIFWDPALPDLTQQEQARVYDQMNATLATLHSVDPDEIGLGDYGKPGNYFARQLARWSAQYQSSQTDTLGDADWLIDWLDRHMVPDDGVTSIVHGDFRIDNMIFDREADKVIALLDWELSTLGHPFADLAYQCMHWRLPHAGDFKGLAGVDRSLSGLPTDDTYIDLYCRRRGIVRPDNWTFYVVFSYFRLLAIMQGVLKRALDGTASNPRNIDMLRDIVAMLAKDARHTALEGA